VKLSSVSVKQSSSWMKKNLELSGIRPINNVVDITNFVMLETGQPMHAFDANKIVGEMTLRKSKKGESITTLDGVRRELPEESIVIEDEKKIIDFAGLMGGESSQIDSSTTEIVLLVPVYESVAIRKASLKTGLRTEASNRFEKKLDPEIHLFTLNRAVKLFLEEAGAIVSSKITTQTRERKENQILVDESIVSNLLGINLSREEIFDLLTPLGFRLSNSPIKENEILISVPSFRTDITIPEDIIEEIARMYGYNKFPKTLPTGVIPIQNELFKPKYEQLIRDELLNLGYSELTGYSLVSEKDLALVGKSSQHTLKVLFPTSTDFAFLRPSLLINLAKAFEVNKNYPENSFFEIGKEFDIEIDKTTKLPSQKVAGVFANNFSLAKVKGDLETMLKKLDLDLLQEPLQNDNLWEFGAKFLDKNTVVATVGRLSTKITNKLVIGDIFAAWLNIEKLNDYDIKNNYSPLPKYPSVHEDISFFLTKKHTIYSIIKALEGVDSLITKVSLKDAYERGGKVSFTLSIEFLDKEGTLETGKIRKLHQKVEHTLIRRFQVEIRKD
jgi:phenylalanyl-tRNA synthetase beta chain